MYFKIILYSHYFVNNGWYDDPEYLLNNVDKIRHIPATIIHARYDMITPMKTAWDLHQVHYIVMYTQ